MLLTPQMLELRKNCLIAGIREAEFWHMTIGEAVREIDAYAERRRDRAYFEYNNALAVGLFIGSMFSSGKAPSIEDIYPDIFSDEEEKKREAEEEARTQRSVANFISFANSFNKRFDNGNREPESENNS